MTARENLLRALRRASPAYVPWGMDLCDTLKEKLLEETGSNDFRDYFHLPYRYIDLHPTRLEGQYEAWYRDVPLKPGSVIDDWGVAQQPVGLAHFTHMAHPMAHMETAEEVLAFPLPDLMAPYRWEGIAEKVQKTQEQGLMAAYFALQVFEPAWYLRGLENMLMDLYNGEEIAIAALERICGLQEQCSRKLAECGFDMIVFGDDVGTQTSLMMSKDIWREYLKPTMRRCISAAKSAKPDIIAFYHSDGNIAELVDEFIDMGVDVLNPVQPECVDPAALKKEYGDRLSFWGGMGTQTTMPFGSPDEVRDTVRRRIAEMGEGGGLVLAPTHLLEPEVPLENVIAFYEAVQSYGRYS